MEKASTEISNLDRIKRDLERLIATGGRLHNAIQAECHPKEFLTALKSEQVKDPAQFVKDLPSFKRTYQPWYSEALSVVKQLLPDRLQDFTSHYNKPKSRKQVTYDSYRIEDYMQELTASQYDKIVVGPYAAIPQFAQQLAILVAAQTRFDSSLHDIRQIVQADLFDSDLDAAKGLLKNGFSRAAGAIAGVVLEKHLSQVYENHRLKASKKHPTIADLNDGLKAAEAIDIPTWRFVQHLADIRNTCDHNKATDPTIDQVQDLLDGIKKIMKTVH